MLICFRFNISVPFLLFVFLNFFPLNIFRTVFCFYVYNFFPCSFSEMLSSSAAFQTVSVPLQLDITNFGGFFTSFLEISAVGSESLPKSNQECSQWCWGMECFVQLHPVCCRLSLLGAMLELISASPLSL